MDIFSNYSNNILSKIQSKKPSKTISKLSSKTQNSKTRNQSGGNSVCNKGEILRAGYITKTGKNVREKCIPAQSYSGRKTSDDIKKYVQSREQIQKEARKKFSKEASKKCPTGYIMREGYKRESHKSHSKKGDSIKVKESWTRPQCIKSQTGKSEKGNKVIVIMEKDILGNYGYKHVKSLSPGERRSTLRKAIREIKPLSVYRRLVALSTLNKGKDTKLAKILKEDSEWIKTQHEYIADRMGSKTMGSKTMGSKTSKSKDSKDSKVSKVSKDSKDSKVSKVSKASKASKVSKASKASKDSKVSKASKVSKKSSKKTQKGGEATEKYSTGYFPNYSILKSEIIKNKLYESNSKNSNFKKLNSKNSDSKLSLSKQRNKLFFYKDE